jgi:uridine kinase
MLIVSLSGGSGSGKTTLANYLASRFHPSILAILPIDAYYRDHSHLTPSEKLNYNFDHPDAIDFELLNDHLRKLKMGFSIKRPTYSFVTCSRKQQVISIKPSTILIVEGLMALTDEKLRLQADVKIYIDVTEANRFARIVERDVLERGRNREIAMDRFYKTVQPMHEAFVEPYKVIADVVIDGNDSNITRITTSIVQTIGNYLYHTNCKSIH